MLNAYSPATLPEAYALLAEKSGALKVIAGGTDLMVLLNARQLDPSDFLDIWGIEALRGISEETGFVRIGALTTFTQIIRSSLIQRSIPSLIAASQTIGAVQIQNRGTIGGNIVNASPAGDSLPVLAAFDATLELGSARCTRVVDFNQFYTGYRRTLLAPDELVLAVRIPKIDKFERDFFRKVGTRRAQAISKTVMAARAMISDGTIQSISIAAGSVAPTVIRARRTEALLSGSKLSGELIEAARRSIEAEVSPISDLRSTEHYRRTVTANILAKFLRELADSRPGASS